MAEKRDTSTDPPTFSQRYDYEPLPQPMRLEELSDDLRREIWNFMRGFLTVFRKQDVFGEYSFKSTEIRKVIEHVLGKLLKLPEDEIRTDHGGAMSQFKEVIERAPFNKVLDLIEIIADIQNDQIESSGTVTRHSDEFIMSKERFIDCVKHQFDQYAAAYWLDTSQLPFQFFPRSSKEQGETIQQAIKTIRKSGMEGAATHLRQAARHINDQQFADSIRESINAVESVARRIAPSENTLGGALKSLEKKGLLKNKQLKQGFEKIYAYTNSEESVRHSLVFQDSADVELDEAIFMFGACASFAAYLTNKHQQTETE